MPLRSTHLATLPIVLSTARRGTSVRKQMPEVGFAERLD